MLNGKFQLKSGSKNGERSKAFTVTLFIACFSASLAVRAFSCTLWAANGDSTKDNSTLIAKNYDWIPDHKTVLKTVPSSKGKFAYFGLYAEYSRSPKFIAGINEKGLVVVTADASTKNEEYYKKIDEKYNRRNLLSDLLSGYADIQSVLKNKDMFKTSKVKNYMIADRENIMYVEAGPDGKYSIRASTNGILYHTNHYIDPVLSSFNLTGRSSLTRYKRIGYLLSGSHPGFTMSDFIKFGSDENDRPNNSIFRTGSSRNPDRTLATWIVELKKDSPPEIYVKLFNPGEETKEFRFTADDRFWQNGGN
jgi:hypothetical protein